MQASRPKRHLNPTIGVSIQQPSRDYCGWDLLIIDEFGFDKLERQEVPDALSLLYKVIDGSRGSVLDF